MSIAEPTPCIEFSDAEVCDDVSLQERDTVCKGELSVTGVARKKSHYLT